MTGIKENSMTPVSELSAAGYVRVVINGQSRIIKKEDLRFEISQILGLSDTIDTLATKQELENALLNSPDVVFTNNYSSLILLEGDTDKLYIINNAETVGGVTYAQYSQFKYNGTNFVLMTNSSQPKTVSDGKRRAGKNGSWVLEAEGKANGIIPVVNATTGQYDAGQIYHKSFATVGDIDNLPAGIHYPSASVTISSKLIARVDVGVYGAVITNVAYTYEGGIFFRDGINSPVLSFSAWKRQLNSTDLTTLNSDIGDLQDRKEVKIFPISIDSSMQESAESPEIGIDHNLDADNYKVVLFDKNGYEFPTAGLMQKLPANPKNQCVLWFSDLIDGTMTGYVEAVI